MDTEDIIDETKSENPAPGTSKSRKPDKKEQGHTDSSEYPLDDSDKNEFILCVHVDICKY